MAYSTEVIQRARQRLDSMKADRASVARERLQQAYTQAPRLRQIDQQLRRTMARAAQAALGQGEAGTAAMEQARKENLALQEERKTLLAELYEPGWLDESPVCERCGGEGYMGSTMCACLETLCRQEQKKQLRLLSCGQGDFEAFRLDYYPETLDRTYGASPRVIMEHNLRVCKKYAETFGPGSGNLLFVGGTGLGKTFLSACIASRVVDQGHCVVYESASQLFSKLEKNRFAPDEQSQEQVDRLYSCDLLIVDDLGTELPGNFVTAALYNLVNERILAGKPMLVSTNLNVSEIEKRYSPQIASRFRGNFQGLTFVGQDIRVLRSKGV